MFFLFFFVFYLTGTGGLKKVFTCQRCGKVLCSKASLKRHIADKHAQRQEEYRCVVCERVYCSRNSLMTHIYTYHKSRPGATELDLKYFWDTLHKHRRRQIVPNNFSCFNAFQIPNVFQYPPFSSWGQWLCWLSSKCHLIYLSYALLFSSIYICFISIFKDFKEHNVLNDQE